MSDALVALLDRIDERLGATGLSDRKASMNAIGKPDLIRDIRRGSFPSSVRLSKLADALATSVDYLLGSKDTAPAAASRPVPSPREMDKDIPVYGTAQGASVEFVSTHDGSICVEQTDLSGSEVIDQFRRPPGLRDRRDIYGLYVAGDSMEPKYESGHGILIDPKRPPAIRDFVVVHLRHGERDYDVSAPAAVLIKRLAKRSATFVELEQYNPPGHFRVSTREILKMERVMPWDEAFGL